MTWNSEKNFVLLHNEALLIPNVRTKYLILPDTSQSRSNQISLKR
jgi:hypothetical protein